MDQGLKETGIVLSNRASRPDDLYGTISLHWYGITHTAEVIFQGGLSWPRPGMAATARRFLLP